MSLSLRANWPKIISGAAILAVAVVAGWISYVHIFDLTLALHQPVLVARLMPIAVDGLVMVGSVVLLQGAWVGWLCIGPGVAISLYANFESGIAYGWRAAVWATIPAVSFAVATFTFERWLTRRAHNAPGADAPATGSAPDTPAIEVVAHAPGADADTGADANTDADASHDEPASETVAPRAPRHGITPEQLEEAAREYAPEIIAGESPSLRTIQTRSRTGRPRAKLILAHLDALIAERGTASVPGRAQARSSAREREPASA